MAKATINYKPPEPPIKSVTLVLTAKEAIVVKSLVGCITSGPQTQNAREATGDIYAALSEAGVPHVNYAIEGSTVKTPVLAITDSKLTDALSGYKSK